MYHCRDPSEKFSSAPSDRQYLSHALKIRFFLHLPFTVLLSIATGTFGLIRDGKLKNSKPKPEGNKDGRDEEGGGGGGEEGEGPTATPQI